MNQGQSTDDMAASCRHLAHCNRLYAMLSRINRTIVRAEEPNGLYEAVCRIAVDAGEFTFAWIGLLEPMGQRMMPVATAGAPVDLARAPLILSASHEDACPWGTAIGDGSPGIVNHFVTGECPTPWQMALAEVAVEAVAAFPLRLEGRVVGAFVVATGEEGFFRLPEVSLLTEVADDLSFALDVMRRDEKRVAAESKIQYLAYYDSQTGLPGRILFSERLAAASCAAGSGQVAVLAVKLRNYHAVLQLLDRGAATRLVQSLAIRLEAALPNCGVGRIAESEFAAYMACPEGLHLVEEAAWRLHAALGEGILLDGRKVFFDSFIGIAVYPRNGDGPATLAAALVAASAGTLDPGECCRFYVADMDLNARQRLDLETDLRGALERREFILHYQPQVDLASGCVIGAEALLRWQRPGKGLISPAEFIPLLEATGLIVPVGDWVIREACRTAKAWQDEGLPPLRMAVNLSTRQFQEADIGALVREALDACGLEYRWLELEITESVVMVNAEVAIQTLKQLKSLGVSHALDDFGTGYSSLSYLQRLPVARIKIDQSFVANLTSDPHDAAIVRAVVGMAHSLGLAVIAEGVETEGQLGYLRGLGCEEIQGYFFSRPLPSEQFAALLREGRILTPAVINRRPERILLVLDDEPGILAALRRLLRRTEIQVLATASVQEAFNLLASHPVGVVVSDQRMPEMTGTEFLRRVRELHPGVVRIVLSGYTELNSIIDAVNRGAIYKFLTKPWEDDALVDSLRDAFHLHEMESENRELSRRVKELMTRDQAPD